MDAAKLVVYSLLCTLALPLAARDVDPVGWVKDGVVKDPEAPVSFRLPPGWSLQGGHRWGDHETTLRIHDSNGVLYSLYYQHPLKPPVKRAAYDELHNAIDRKVRQRRDRDKMPNYRTRGPSFTKHEINGLPGLSYIGEFTSQGRPHCEFMLRVLGKKTKAHFFVMLPAGEPFEAAMRNITEVAATLMIE